MTLNSYIPGLLRKIIQMVYRKERAFPPAYKRYPKLFQIMDEVIHRLHIWIDREDHNIKNKVALDHCKTASIIRSFNLLKSINLLLKNDHWEDAAILARSLFELVLNFEEIIKDETNAKAQAIKYFKVQYLQEYIHKMNLIDYEITTGRRSKKDIAIRDKLDISAKSLFSEFIDTSKPTGWKTSWHDKSVFNLAKNSRNKMHLYNYKILYSLLSDISHSGPLGTGTSFSLGASPAKSKEDLFKQTEEHNRKYMLMVSSMTIIWIAELLLLAGSVLREFDPAECKNFLNKARGLYEKEAV